MPSLIRSASKILSHAANTSDATFDMVIETTTDNELFTIRCHTVGTFNATIDWGDGTTSTVTSYNDANLTHTYASASEHTISISGTFPSIYMHAAANNSRNKVKRVLNFGNVGWQNLYRAFYGCENMTSFVSKNCDTSSVTNMDSMFHDCTSVTTLDVGGFNTSSVTSMYAMIHNCSITSLDVSNWDTSSVRNMSYVISNNSNLTSVDVSNWDTSSVTNMHSMFREMTALTTCDVSNWDTSSVTDMSNIFSSCVVLTTLDVSGFNTSSVTNMSNMFYICYNLTTIDVSNWNTSSATTMSGMFQACYDVTSLDVSGFNTSLVTNMYAMFYRCRAVTAGLDVSSFDTSLVTRMEYMFQELGTDNGASIDIIGVENFDIEVLIQQALRNFMVGVAIPTARYDALLINWDAQDPFDGMFPNFGSSQYTAGGTAAAARANLISTDGWAISDGGTA